MAPYLYFRYRMNYKWFILIFLVVAAYGLGRLSVNSVAPKSTKTVSSDRYPQRQQALDAGWFLADNFLQPSISQMNGIVTYEKVTNVYAKTSGKFEFGDVEGGTNFFFNEHQVLYRINMDAALYTLMTKKAQLMEKITVKKPELTERFPSELNKWMTWKSDLDPSKRFMGTPKYNSVDEKDWAIETGVYLDFIEIKRLEKELENFIHLTSNKGYVIGWKVKQGDVVKKDQVICSVASSLSKIVEFTVPASVFASFDLDGAVLYDGSGKKLTHQFIGSSKKGDEVILQYALLSNVTIGSVVTLKTKMEKLLFSIPITLLVKDQLTVKRAGQLILLKVTSEKGIKTGFINTELLQRGDLIKSR